jgi:hypothetical protein
MRAPEEMPMPKQATAKAESTGGKTRKRSVAKTAAPKVSERVLSQLSHDEIAQHAYSLYMARGASEGGDIHDWLQAENELRARAG